MKTSETVNNIMSDMPNGEEKLHALELCIVKAEEEKDIESSYYTRMAQNEVAAAIRRYDMLMENFAWCLDVYEQHLDTYATEPLLKQFYLFLRHLHYFPLISKEEINDYYAYYLQLLLQNNYSLRSFYQLKLHQSLDSGDETGVRMYRPLWQEAERDSLGVCILCEQQLQMRIHFEEGELTEGFRLSEELLSSKDRCKDVPHTVYPYLLLPAWNMERVKEAKLWQEQGYFLLRKNPKYIVELSHMLLYLSVTDLKKAGEVFRLHIEMADECTDLHGRFYFYLASWCMLERAELEMYPYHEEDADWFAEHVPALAQEFDERNGNSHYQKTIQEWLSYVRA